MAGEAGDFLKSTEGKFSIIYSSATEASSKHPDVNEDALGYGDGWVLVLDGVGGQIGGDKASNFVLVEMSKVIEGKDPTNYNVVEGRVHDAVDDIHKKLTAKFPGSATTMILGRTYNRDGKKSLFIASIGDSRAYLLRDGVLKKITDDDNRMSRETALKIDNAKSAEDLNPEELYNFKTRNMISASIGGRSVPGVNPYMRDLVSGDKYIFATDGVFDNLNTSEIEVIVNKGGNIAKELISSAKARSLEGSFRSKQDDISAVVMEVE